MEEFEKQQVIRACFSEGRKYHPGIHRGLNAIVANPQSMRSTFFLFTVASRYKQEGFYSLTAKRNLEIHSILEGCNDTMITLYLHGNQETPFAIISGFCLAERVKVVQLLAVFPYTVLNVCGWCRLEGSTQYCLFPLTYIKVIIDSSLICRQEYNDLFLFLSIFVHDPFLGMLFSS